MLTEDFVRWKRVAAAATLAMLLAPGTAGAQSAADLHAAYLQGKVGYTTAAQLVAAGTASAQGGGSMGCRWATTITPRIIRTRPEAWRYAAGASRWHAGAKQQLDERHADERHTAG